MKTSSNADIFYDKGVRVLGGFVKRRNFSLKTTIILISLVLFILTISIISVLVFYNWDKSAKANLKIIAKDVNSNINQKIEWFLDEPKQMDETMLLRIKTSSIDLENEDLRDKYFVSELETRDPYIYSFSYGSETGEYYGARRSENGSIEIMENDDSTNHESLYYSITSEQTKQKLTQNAGVFDPRVRDWYLAAKEKKNLAFSPIYKHFYKNDLSLSVAMPVYDNTGKLKGVLGTHLILSDMNKYLHDISKEKSGISFIVEKDSGNLVANSLNKSNFKITSDSKLKRFTPNDLKNKTLHDIYTTYAASHKVSFEIDKYEINVSEYKDKGIDWVVFVAVPTKIVMDDVYKNLQLTILFSAGILVVAILIFVLVTGAYFKPLSLLLDGTKAIANGDLEKRVEIKRNDELGILGMAFNDMTGRINKLVNHLEDMVEERTFELKKSNELLNESKENLSLILNSTAEAIFGIDLDGNCTFCNESCIRLLHYEREEELIGKSLKQIIYGNQKESFNGDLPNFIMESIKGEIGSHSDNESFYRADGAKLEVEYYSYPQWKEKKVIGAVITFLDVSERKQSEKHIAYLNSHDPLTGLYNRRHYEEALKRIDCKENLPISIIFGDVNGLKLTNDVFGHSAGDMLIKRVGETLKKICHSTDIVARIGGDEFIIILPKTSEHVANEILIQIKELIREEKIEAIKCSIALGLDTKNYVYQNINRIVEDAENKMYREKTINREKTDSEMIDTIVETLHKKSKREREHSYIVSEICQKIGKKLHLPQSDIRKLKEVGYIHDIGKIVLPDEILIKLESGEELSEEEQLQYDQHAVIGYRILSLFSNTLDLAEGVYAHHEYWDGTGYPKRLKGEEIPLMARIISIADSYDNYFRRSKDHSLSKKNVMQEMKKNSGKSFDPAILEAFFEILDTEKEV